MKRSFSTSVGTIEILVDEESRIISAYRFDAERRPVAAAIESWDHIDLADLLSRQTGVPRGEAIDIASAVTGESRGLGNRSRQPEQWVAANSAYTAAEHAGLALRFVAVLLDALIVFLPLGIVVALLSGGGYVESGDGYANAGVDVGGNAFWLLLILGLGYYIVCEAATGMTLGKRMVGIRVVGEDGEQLTFGAALVRNLLRVVDALFFYLVGGLFALASSRGQRLGDRAAHTLVVRG